jgi:hypothetical protein
VIFEKQRILEKKNGRNHSILGIGSVQNLKKNSSIYTKKNLINGKGVLTS